MLQSILKGRRRTVSAGIAATLLVAAIAMAGINLSGASPTSANQGPQLRIFRVVALSDAGVVGEVHHRIALSGDGTFTANQVNGTGTFVHFDQNTAGPGVTILGSGTWRARKVLSYERGFGTLGDVDSGILEMEVTLFPDGGPKTGVSAVLRVICNIGPAGISTGEPEGFVLTVQDLTFEPIIVPVDSTSLPIGLTHISVPGSR